MVSKLLKYMFFQTHTYALSRDLHVPLSVPLKFPNLNIFFVTLHFYNLSPFLKAKEMGRKEFQYFS